MLIAVYQSRVLQAREMELARAVLAAHGASESLVVRVAARVCTCRATMYVCLSDESLSDESC